VLLTIKLNIFSSL